MNGVAEKCMQDISARSRSLRNRSGLHLSQWEITTRHAVYLKNRSPSKALPFGEAESLSQAITPFEAYNNRQPDFPKLKVFGCRASARNPQQPGQPRKKFESRILRGEHILVGMSGNQIFQLLHIKTPRGIETADVDFNEYSFPA